MPGRRSTSSRRKRRSSAWAYSARPAWCARKATRRRSPARKPATCSFTKATTGEPCLSRGSIVSTPDGVVYASQNGLILVGPSGIQNVTEQLITKDEWIKDYAPQYLRAVRYQNGYLALRMPPNPNPAQRLLSRSDRSQGGADRAVRLRCHRRHQRRLLVRRGVHLQGRHDPALGPADQRPDAGAVALEGVPVSVPGKLRRLRRLLGRRPLFEFQLRHLDHADDREGAA